jgi:hypothetical protein
MASSSCPVSAFNELTLSSGPPVPASAGPQTVQWFWYDPGQAKWMLARESDLMERQYQEWLCGEYSSYIYHCFGNGAKAIVDMNSMETECASTGCESLHESLYTPGECMQGVVPRAQLIPDDHMTFKVMRVEL